MKRHGVYYITGGLRSGKSLICTRKIQEFLQEDRKVVTNFDLKLEHMLPHQKKNVCCLRVPDHPTVDDLEAIGLGYDHEDPEHYEESQFGLIVLDELGTWMNSRNWQDKTRRPVIDWLLHSGKRRWILMLIIQDLELLDNQARAATANQFVVRCRRLGDYAIPIISPIWKFITGNTVTLPNSHIAIVRNGSEHNAPVADRWIYRGEDLFKAYNTRQIFDVRDSPSACMLYSYLSPWYLAGRYEPIKNWAYWVGWLRVRPHVLLIPQVFVLLLSVVSLSVAVYSVRTQAKIQNALLGLASRVDTLKSAQSHAFLNQPASMPIVPVSVSSLAPEAPKIDKCESFRAASDGIEIVGYSSRPSGVSYVLRAGEQEFNSGRYVSSGYGVVSNGACHMQITKQECTADIYCPVPSSTGKTAATGSEPFGSAGADALKKGFMKAAETAL